MRSSIAALTASVFVVGTSEYLIAGLLPQVAADLGVSVPVAGQAVTAYALGVVIGGPLVTLATVRLPRKGLAIGLLLLFAAGNAVSACAFNIGIAAGSALGGSLVALDGLRWLGLAAAVLSLGALALTYALAERPAAVSQKVGTAA
ncbi:MFS transporter, partial [Nonomuraea sp. RK-328]|nr:MFS transporter [Nonomuraea sp. RK-328]